MFFLNHETKKYVWDYLRTVRSGVDVNDTALAIQRMVLAKFFFTGMIYMSVTTCDTACRLA
jgi:hypothetical protein